MRARHAVGQLEQYGLEKPFGGIDPDWALGIERRENAVQAWSIPSRYSSAVSRALSMC